MATTKRVTSGVRPTDIIGKYERLKELSHDLMVAAEKDDVYQVEKAAIAMRVWFIENEPEFQH